LLHHSYGQSEVVGVLKGTPKIQNFISNAYYAGAINYKVTQDARGIIYVANNRGLLEFDGSSWRLYSLPNQSPIYDFAIDSTGKIYVGGEEEIGYFSPNNKGELKYNSLATNELNIQTITQVFLSGSSIYFLDKSELFYLENGIIKTISIDTQSKTKAFPLANKFYLNTTTPPLLYQNIFQKESLERIPFNPVAIVPYAAGQLLLASEKGDFYTLNEDDFNLKKKNFSANTFFELNNITVITPLKDDNYAIGTQSGGVAIMNKEGELLYLANKAAGLQNDYIRSVFQDDRNNLWLATNNGISFISFNSPFSVFNEQAGLNGAATSAKVYRNYLYVATRQGLFYKPWESSGNLYYDNWGFDQLEGFSGEINQLKEIGGNLYATSSKGLYQIENNRLRLIQEGACKGITQVADKIIVAGNSSDFKSYQLNNGILVYNHNISGEENTTYKKIYASADGKKLWAESFSEIYLIDFNEGFNSVSAKKVLKDFKGVDAYKKYHLHRVNEQIWISTGNKIFVFNIADNSFQKLQSFGNQLEGVHEIKHITNDENGNIWMLTNIGVKFLEKKEENYVLKSDVFNQFKKQSLYFINTLDKNNILLGSPQGLIHYSPQAGEASQDQSEQKLVTLIRKVSVIGADTAIFNGTFLTTSGSVVMQPNSQHEVLPWERKSLHFEVALPWYNQTEKTQYRCYLQGFDKDWGDWTSASAIDYTNLPQGKYIFTAQSKNVYGLLSAEATYEFAIEAPWYYRWWAYFIYFFAAALIYFIGIKINLVRLKNANQILEKEVEKRTLEIVEKNEEIVLQNQQLAELNEEKNHIIGVLAHDMRNPLHQIRGLADLSELRFPNIDPELKEYHGYMVQAVERLNEMITKILDLKAIESGKVNMTLEPVNLHHLLNATADSLKTDAEKKGIKLIKNLNIVEVNVIADKSYLLQVFENLLSNAIKFSPKNKSIFLQLEQKNGSIIATVQDEGPGINEEDMQKLFGKFQKLTARPTDGESSTGLGLSIVKKYIEAMDGEVWCESKEGQGAAFKVKFSKI